MNVNELLDTIEDTLAESANMPLSGGKRIVDVDQIQEYLDEIRANLPGELRQAQAIVNDRGQIVDSANAQAKAIIRQAEERARVLVSESEIVKSAQQRAAEIMAQAQAVGGAGARPPVEAVKDPLGIVRCNPLTEVLHPDLHTIHPPRQGQVNLLAVL